jgi:AraC-like DNA-binding protein
VWTSIQDDSYVVVVDDVALAATTVVRRVSGQTAKKLIEQETVDEIKHTLLHTQLTAKEISAQFHFPNTSSFCRFFTRHTGVTPQEFQKNSLIIK